MYIPFIWKNKGEGEKTFLTAANLNHIENGISTLEQLLVGAWQNMAYGADVEAGSHPFLVRKELSDKLAFAGAVKAKVKMVPSENEGPILGTSPIPFKGGSSGFLYDGAIRYNSGAGKHETGVVIECEDGTNLIRLAGGPEIEAGDQIDFDGISLKLA